MLDGLVLQNDHPDLPADRGAGAITCGQPPFARAGAFQAFRREQAGFGEDRAGSSSAVERFGLYLIPRAPRCTRREGAKASIDSKSRRSRRRQVARGSRNPARLRR
jgi:hypothetical protein